MTPCGSRNVKLFFKCVPFHVFKFLFYSHRKMRVYANNFTVTSNVIVFCCLNLLYKIRFLYKSMPSRAETALFESRPRWPRPSLVHKKLKEMLNSVYFSNRFQFQKCCCETCLPRDIFYIFYRK